MDLAYRNVLASQGLVFHGGVTPFELKPEWKADFTLAMDAQPQLVTSPNAGIPAFLANLIDPEVIRVIFEPMRAAEIFGETKKGDWTTLSAQFPVVEQTGEVSSYGDHNNNGSSGANVNWVPRQSYHFQTVSQWGERELDMYGLAKINYKSEVDMGSILAIQKFHNRTYFFGVAGLDLYGILNSPDNIAPITPTLKTGGGFGWSFDTPARQIYADVQKAFQQLQVQMGGNVEMTDKMTLALSPTDAVFLNNISEFNVSVRQSIADNFPNLTIRTAPEYGQVEGGLMQLILDSYEGQKTAYTAFTEKLRAHPVIPALSAFAQKKSAGTFGWINRRPIAIVGMLGIHADD